MLSDDSRTHQNHGNAQKYREKCKVSHAEFFLPTSRAWLPVFIRLQAGQLSHESGWRCAEAAASHRHSVAAGDGDQ